MKKSLVLILLVCLMLSACGTAAKVETTAAPAPPTPAPTVEIATAPTVEIAAAPACVLPCGTAFDMESISNCTASVYLREGDVFADENGRVVMRLGICSYDLYDPAQIGALKAGDSIRVGSSDILIESISESPRGILINGGLDTGGLELQSDKSGYYYESGYNDAKAFYQLAEVVLPVAEDFTYVDESDLDKGAAVYSAAELMSEGVVDYFFIPRNTLVLIKDGLISGMRRVYIP